MSISNMSRESTGTAEKHSTEPSEYYTGHVVTYVRRLPQLFAHLEEKKIEPINISYTLD